MVAAANTYTNMHASPTMLILELPHEQYLFIVPTSESAVYCYLPVAWST